jgi:hypothetical protein
MTPNAWSRISRLIVAGSVTCHGHHPGAPDHLDSANATNDGPLHPFHEVRFLRGSGSPSCDALRGDVAAGDIETEDPDTSGVMG